MAEAPYETASDWLTDAARLFAGRIERLLDHRAGTPEARLIGLVETADAARLLQQIASGPEKVAPEDDAQASLAQRLSNKSALKRIEVGRFLQLIKDEGKMALPLALLTLAAVEPRLAALLGWLNDDAQRRYVTPALILRLCGSDAPSPLEWTSGSLFELNCVTLGGTRDSLPADRPIRLTEHLAKWLAGQIDEACIDPSLKGHLTPALAVPLDQLGIGRRIEPQFEPFSVQGAQGTGRAAVAAAILQQQGARPLRLTAPGQMNDIRTRLAIALRDAALTGSGLILEMADQYALPDLRWAADVALCPLAFVTRSRLPMDIPHLRCPELGAPRLRTLWTHRLGADREQEAARLAHQFRLPVDDILSIRSGPSHSFEDIRKACLERSAGTLEHHATQVVCRHDWDDLVLPPRQMSALRRVVSRARHAQQVFDTWGFGDKLVPNRGLSALFSGPSGAGKTLSASVVARSIGLPLYRVDLSATVSKYIGETEKNLEQIFSAAEAGNACLLFDECDAIFGKRSEVSDAHDRYANIETSYLLQRMESHRGVVMMSTNHPQNIDEAFMRRIDLAVEFALPDARLRIMLWERLLPQNASADIDAALLGERFELSGGSIRNCLVSAAFIAAEAGERINTSHCIRAVAQEYEKTGRPLTRAEFGESYPVLRPRREA